MQHSHVFLSCSNDISTLGKHHLFFTAAQYSLYYIKGKELNHKKKKEIKCLNSVQLENIKVGDLNSENSISISVTFMLW